MMSVPLIMSRFRLEASASCGRTMAGRKFAKAFNPLRRLSSPFSGRCSLGYASHLYLSADNGPTLRYGRSRSLRPSRIKPSLCLGQPGPYKGQAGKQAARSLCSELSASSTLCLSQAPTHPPMAASKTASARLHVSKVLFGKGVPVASVAAPPISASWKLKSAPSVFPAARNTSVATAVISGPIPSPASTATLCKVAQTTVAVAQGWDANPGCLRTANGGRLASTSRGEAPSCSHSAAILQI